LCEAPDQFNQGALPDLQVRVVRIFNTYGPRMALDDGRVVSNFVAQALTDQDLTVYGDGQQTRSFQYVSDLIKGMTLSHKPKCIRFDQRRDTPRHRPKPLAFIFASSTYLT